MLYATCYSSLQSVPNIPFYFFFNALLLVLTLMNIYWFLVSRGSSAPPMLASPSSAAPAPVPAARLSWGRPGGTAGMGGLWRMEGRRESHASARGAPLCLEFKWSRTLGIHRERAITAAGAGWNLIGVQMLWHPLKLWGGGEKGGLGGLAPASSTLGRAGQHLSSSSCGDGIGWGWLQDAAGHQPHPRALAVPEGSARPFLGSGTVEEGPT